MVSVKATRAIPTAPATSSPRSDTDTLGMVNGGSPLGSVPTSDTPWLPRSNSTAAPIESTTATSTPGTFGIQCCSTRMTMSPNSPMATAAITVSPARIPLTNPFAVSDQGVGVHRETEQLRKLAHQDRECEAGHVANLGGLGEQVGHKSQLRHARQNHGGAHQYGKHRCQSDRTRGTSVGTRERKDRGCNHRTERGIRPQHQDPRGSHDGVSGKTEHRRVEARNGRKAREFRRRPSPGERGSQ